MSVTIAGGTASAAARLRCCWFGGVVPPLLPCTTITTAMISPMMSRMIATSPKIFQKLYGRSPDTFPLRPLIRIWNSFSW